jgi:hypothetical protein
MRAFAAERIFGPLGMTASQYLDDQTLLVPDRALGYSVDPEGVRQAPAYVETVGSGSVYSTVDDLARWDESFYTAALGDAALLELVQTPARLNDGTALTYAFGLMVDRWRGLRRVHHGGALAGYRSTIVRFPDQHFSAIVLCNFAQANPDGLAAQIAEIYLAGQLTAPEAGSTQRAAPIDPAFGRRIAGIYRSTRTGQVLRIDATDTAVELQYAGLRTALRAAGGNRVRLAPIGGLAGEAAIEFSGEPVASRAILTGLGSRPDIFERVQPAATDTRSLAALAGRYRSEEIGVTWSVELRDGALVARRAGGADIPFEPIYRDAFRTGPANAVVERDGSGRPRALLITTGRSRNIRFERERGS